MDQTAWRFSWYFAISQLKTKYRFTALGFLWNFLEPALYLVILSLVFSVINRMDISDYAVFLFSALVPWRYFEKVVTSSMESIAGGEWLLKKMYVSPFTFPVNKFIISTFEFSFSITVAFIIFAFLKENWTIHLIILPLSIIPWALFGIGLGMISAVLYIFFRDVRPLIQMILTLVFFTSPILFHQNIFAPDSLQANLMEYHPITYFAALFQKPIYTDIWPSGIDWLVSVSISLLTVFTGYYLIQKFKNKFYFYL
jgi:ABC-type polysaccharide/polyol phosphate export permease